MINVYLHHKIDNKCLVDNFLGYMIEQLDIDESKVPDMCYVLYKYYGTTMAGLRVCLKSFFLFISFLGQLFC